MTKYEQGRWDMFVLMSCWYWGKQYYFLQDDGTVYSRYSGSYMTVEHAYQEFGHILDMG